MINIVAPIKEEWILAKIARMLHQHIPDTKLSDRIDPQADINHFVNYALFKPVETKVTGWFTHPPFYKIAQQMDWCICQAEQYAEQLRARGLRATTITPGIDEIFTPKLVLGVCGRKYKRKGEDLIKEVQKLDFVEIKFTHHSWGAEDIPFKNLPQFYNSIDYLLVTSSLEGGPIPVGEAIACGKKVIAPLEIGNVKIFEKNIIPYQRNAESLIGVLDNLYQERKKISTDVAHLTWKEFARRHQLIFNRL